MCKNRVCVVMVIVLGFAGSASAIQVVDDFEGGNLDIWDISQGQDAVAIGPDPLHPGNNCLVFSPETHTMRTPWDLGEGNAETLFYRLMYDMEPGGTVTLIFGPSDPDGTGWGNYYCIARMNSYGDSANVPDMDVSTGASGYTDVVQADLEPLIWYNVLLDINSATKTYDVYIDDVLVFGQATFRSAHSPADLEYILLKTTTWSNNFANGKVYVDDITIGGVPTDFQPKAYKPNPKDGDLHLATWVSLEWRAGDSAVSHDVYIGDNFEDVDNGAGDTFQGNQTETTLLAGFPGFAIPGGFTPGMTYYWRVDEVNDADPNSPWKGDIWSFSLPPKTAYFPDPVNGAEFVDPNTILSWTAGDGAKMHTFYIGNNFDEVNSATGGTMSGTASFDPGLLESEKVYYWRVDEFDGIETHKGGIWAFTTPGAVGNSQPANGAVDVPMIATLNWTAADTAASHEVYFGTDPKAVNNATTASPEYVGARALGAESYDPGGLAWESSYYWRIDEVYAAGAVKGLIWSFTTADFILVDDFESYNDVDPPDAASNRVFDKWIDGFGTTTNGALVGNDLPPYTEQTIVHGGSQSMPYLYDNSNKTSEATLTLLYPRDWTEADVTKLSLWFIGDPANAADRMFVALGPGAPGVVYHDDPAATQIAGWNEWVIDLTRFAGVDLSNVSTITLGFGTKNSPAAGGTGTMYFDDIRLCRL